jgi:hypothetical protein
MVNELMEILRHAGARSDSSQIGWRNHFAAALGTDDYLRCERLVESGTSRAGDKVKFGVLSIKHRACEIIVTITPTKIEVSRKEKR